MSSKNIGSSHPSCKRYDLFLLERGYSQHRIRIVGVDAKVSDAAWLTWQTDKVNKLDKLIDFWEFLAHFRGDCRQVGGG